MLAFEHIDSLPKKTVFVENDVTSLFSFGDESEEEDEEKEDARIDSSKVADEGGNVVTDIVFEHEDVNCAYNISLSINQFSFHVANANQIWPGTFNLAYFLARNRHVLVHNLSVSENSENLKILELGAATGALSLFLKKLDSTLFNNIITSDIDDGGQIEENIKRNFELNSVSEVIHVPHTWGEEWSFPQNDFDYIIASDILLYVKAYPNLVKTLVYFFQGGKVKEFIMSWNRRIDSTKIFYDLMQEAGFKRKHYGSCIYGFTFESSNINKSELI
jgi:hypothetical protein